MPPKKQQKKKKAAKAAAASYGPLPSAVFAEHDHVGMVKRMTVPDNQIYTIVQTNDGLTQQTSSFNNGVMGFTLNSWSQYTQFAAVFDQYRIEEVQVVFRPMFTANQVSGSTTFYIPTLYVVADYDDSTSLTTAAAFESYTNCNMSVNETVAVRLTPHSAQAAYSGAFTSYANKTYQWIDCSSPGVVHYGIKWGIDAGGAGQTSFQSWKIQVRQRISFRNIR